MAEKSKTDRLFDREGAVGDFAFDASVTHVFDDMVRRSVPGYDDMLAGIGEFSARFLSKDSKAYDLGCSLGSASLAILDRSDCAGLRLSLVDLSEPMIESAKNRLGAYKFKADIDFLCQDLNALKVEDASFVVLNLTLQFLEPGQMRQQLINKIFAGMKPGGALILSEKVRFEDPQMQRVLDEQQMDFKRKQGYSDLEIAQKRTALENVMKLDTIDSHKQRLRTAGFSSVEIWYQNLNFVSFLAIRS